MCSFPQHQPPPALLASRSTHVLTHSLACAPSLRGVAFHSRGRDRRWMESLPHRQSAHLESWEGVIYVLFFLSACPPFFAHHFFFVFVRPPCFAQPRRLFGVCCLVRNACITTFLRRPKLQCFYFWIWLSS